MAKINKNFNNYCGSKDNYGRGGQFGHHSKPQNESKYSRAVHLFKEIFDCIVASKGIFHHPINFVASSSLRLLCEARAEWSILCHSTNCISFRQLDLVWEDHWNVLSKNEHVTKNGWVSVQISCFKSPATQLIGWQWRKASAVIQSVGSVTVYLQGASHLRIPMCFIFNDMVSFQDHQFFVHVYTICAKLQDQIFSLSFLI